MIQKQDCRIINRLPKTTESLNYVSPQNHFVSSCFVLSFMLMSKYRKEFQILKRYHIGWRYVYGFLKASRAKIS